MAQQILRAAGSGDRRRVAHLAARPDWSRGAGALLLVLLTGGGLLSGCSRTDLATTTSPAQHQGVTSGASSPSPGTPGEGESASSKDPSSSLDPGSSLVAAATTGTVTVWSEAGHGSRQRLSNPTPTGGPLTFLVTQTRPGWLKVLLPQRPNGSTGWISQQQVELATTPYRLVISMSEHRLDVFYQGHRQASHPVGVGKVATPTPTGTYYLTELIQPPDPGGVYGPYAFGLSAFSNTLKTFAGGPGQLGLHGTDAPHGLGHDVSHGCLRVANSVIRQLAEQVPLGTPVEIRA